LTEVVPEDEEVSMTGVFSENEDKDKARDTAEPPRRGVTFASVHLEVSKSFQPFEPSTKPRSILKKKRQTLKLRFSKPDTQRASEPKRKPGSHIRNFFRNTQAGISFRQRTAGISFRRTQGDNSSPPQRTPRIPSLEATRARNRSIATRMSPPPANAIGLSPFLSNTCEGECKLSPSPPTSPNSAVNPTFSGEALQELLRSFGGVAGVINEAKRKQQKLLKKFKPTPDQDRPVSPRTQPGTFGDHDASSVPQLGVDMGIAAALGLSEEEVWLQQGELLKFQQQKAQKRAMSPRNRSTLPQLRGSQIADAWQTNTRGRQASVFCSKELAPTTQPSQTMAIPRTCPSLRLQRGVIPELETRRPISPAFSLSPSLSNTSGLSLPASPTMPAPGTPEFLKYMQDAAKRKEAEGEPMISGNLMREAFRGTTNFDKLAAREQDVRAAAVKRKRDEEEEEATNDSVPLKLTTEERERRIKRRDERKRERDKALAELKKEPSTASSTNVASHTSSVSTSTNFRSPTTQNTTNSFPATSSLIWPIDETNAGTSPSGDPEELVSSGAQKVDMSSGERGSGKSSSIESDDLSDLSEGWSERDSVDSNEEEKSPSPTQLRSGRQSASALTDSRRWPRPRNTREQNNMLRMSRQGRAPSEDSETDEDRDWIIRCRSNSRRQREEQAWDDDVAQVLIENGKRANSEYQRQKRLRISSMDESHRRTERLDAATSILAQEEVERASEVDSAIGSANTRAEVTTSVEAFVPALEPVPELEQVDLSRSQTERMTISAPSSPSLPLPLTLATLTGRSPPPPDDFEEDTRGRTMEGFTDAELEDVLTMGEPAVTIPGPVHSVRMEDIVPMGYGQRRPSVRPLSPILHPCLDDNARGRTPTRPVYTDPSMREELEEQERERGRNKRERAVNLLSSNSPPSTVEGGREGGSTRTRVFRTDNGSVSVTGREEPRRLTPEPFTPEPEPEPRRPEVEEYTPEREPEPMVMDDVVYGHIDPTVTDLENMIDEEDLVDDERKDLGDQRLSR
jgi:osmotically-inducible protein OsmY